MPKKQAAARKTGASARKSRRSLTDAKKRGFEPESIEDNTRLDILTHAKEGYEQKPRVEVCGFIATNGKKQRVFRSPNRSEEPGHNFRTCPNQWRKVEDSGWNIVAVYHSHINRAPAASDGDKAGAEAAGIPFVIVGMPTGAFGFYAPTGWKPGLEGRPYVFGILDCRTLHRDYHRDVLGIVVPDFDYPDKWWKKGKDLFQKHYKEAGFVEVGTLQKHDTLLIQIPPSPVANHCAIYLGDGQILHHLGDRLSKREPYQDGVGYAQAVQKIVRHKSLC